MSVANFPLAPSREWGHNTVVAAEPRGGTLFTAPLSGSKEANTLVMRAGVRPPALPHGPGPCVLCLKCAAGMRMDGREVMVEQPRLRVCLC